ncbi:sporulation protein [Streptomyces sp. NPDC057555]|uniref:sporulation protein n=1 Tax=Streptomyces sp. NPDC057555 TaxID=3346166 RepID=UPI003693FC4F
MGFKKVLASLGAGGASVETVLFEENVVPGGLVQGEVRIQGGSVPQAIQGLSVGLAARVEDEPGGGGVPRDVAFGGQRLGGAFEVQPGAVHTVPFGLEVPWEAPLTDLLGQALPGAGTGVTTQLAIARAVDSHDLDPVRVHPVPAQQVVLEALRRLGFHFSGAAVVTGQIHGTRQQLPFHQEFTFAAPPQYRGLGEVALAFVADGREMDVVWEMDKGRRPFHSEADSHRSRTVGMDAVEGTDWAGCLTHWLAEVGGRRNWL